MEIVDAEAAHAAAIARIYEPVVTGTTISFEAEAPDADEIARRIATHRPWLVAIERGAVVGYAYASPFKDRDAYRWTVETTIYVDPGHQRRGVAKALVDVLLARLRAEGIHTAVAVISLPNAASVATAQAAGFAHVGTIPRAGHKMGRWIDVGFWVREL